MKNWSGTAGSFIFFHITVISQIQCYYLFKHVTPYNHVTHSALMLHLYIDSTLYTHCLRLKLPWVLLRASLSYPDRRDTE